jgi:hypothetical protein
MIASGPEPGPKKGEVAGSVQLDESFFKNDSMYFPLQVRVDPQLLARLDRAAAPR